MTSRAFSLFAPCAVRPAAQEVFPRPSDGEGYQRDSATVLLYKLNEGAGAVAHDLSLNANHGMIEGAVWTGGRYLGGLLFDGINDSVRAPDSPSLRIAGPLTLEAWIRPGADHGGTGTIVAKRLSYSLAVQESPVLRVVGTIWRGGTALKVTSTDRLELEVWQHVAFTFDGAALAIFIDGDPDATLSIGPGGVDVNSEPLLVGAYRRNPGQAFYNGALDEVRVSNAARSISELDPNRA